MAGFPTQPYHTSIEISHEIPLQDRIVRALDWQGNERATLDALAHEKGIRVIAGPVFGVGETDGFDTVHCVAVVEAKP